MKKLFTLLILLGLCNITTSAIAYYGPDDFYWQNERYMEQQNQYQQNMLNMQQQQMKQQRDWQQQQMQIQKNSQFQQCIQSCNARVEQGYVQRGSAQDRGCGSMCLINAQ